MNQNQTLVNIVVLNVVQVQIKNNNRIEYVSFNTTIYYDDNNLYYLFLLNMNDRERLQIAEELLNTDTAFEADCLTLDIINKRPTTPREVEFAKLIMRLYRLVHPRFGSCIHENWENENEKSLAELLKNN